MTTLPEQNINTHPSRLPSLDGWRALAILLVLLAHSTLLPGFPQYLSKLFYWLVDGALGVRIFFCISGFLITHLLLKEAVQNGERLRLRLFYLRRCLRILPVYSAFCLFLAFIGWLGFFKIGAAEWAGVLTFTRNYFGQDFLTGHLWSLGVEIQFYLVWPLIFTFCLSYKKPIVLVAILLVPLFFCPVFRSLSYLKFYPASLETLFLPTSFLLLADIPAFGCLAALLWFYLKNPAKLSLLHSRLLLYLGLALILLPHFAMKKLTAGIITVPFGYTLQSLGIIILILQSLSHQNFFFPLLNARPMLFLGAISYSLYIWQQPFFSPKVSSRPELEWLFKTPLWISALLIAAIFSYFLIEKTSAKLHARLHSPIQ